MTRVIAIANQKGGVGKTTTAVTLAHGLARRGKEVLLVDLDPQGQVAVSLGLNQEAGAFNLLIAHDPSLEIVRQWIRNTGRKGLWIIPGNTTTSTAQTVINAEGRAVDCVRRAVQPLTRNGLDYIVFDTAPSVGGIQERAVWASDLLIIPTATDFLAADGVAKMIEMLGELRRKAWRGALLGVLPTFYDETTRESRTILTMLREHFDDQVLTPIHRATVLRECAAEGKTIYERDANSRSAQEYEALVNLVARMR